MTAATLARGLTTSCPSWCEVDHRSAAARKDDSALGGRFHVRTFGTVRGELTVARTRLDHADRTGAEVVDVGWGDRWPDDLTADELVELDRLSKLATT